MEGIHETRIMTPAKHRLRRGKGSSKTQCSKQPLNEGRAGDHFREDGGEISPACNKGTEAKKKRLI